MQTRSVSSRAPQQLRPLTYRPADATGSNRLHQKNRVRGVKTRCAPGPRGGGPGRGAFATRDEVPSGKLWGTKRLRQWGRRGQGPRGFAQAPRRSRPSDPDALSGTTAEGWAAYLVRCREHHASDDRWQAHEPTPRGLIPTGDFHQPTPGRTGGTFAGRTPRGTGWVLLRGCSAGGSRDREGPMSSRAERPAPTTGGPGWADSSRRTGDPGRGCSRKLLARCPASDTGGVVGPRRHRLPRPRRGSVLRPALRHSPSPAPLELPTRC